jgi:predicted TIM-barrel fold metal-dependent hydrolase
MQGTVVDADGHVMEDETIADYIEEPYRSKGQLLTMSRIFPNFDFHHLALYTQSPSSFGGGKPVGPEQWKEFIEYARFEYAVVYPTMGLAMGNISHPDWACAAARTYNNWLYNRYLKAVPRLKGMALIPLQDVPEAVNELRRAVRELGMLGAMLPSRGLPFDLGHKNYWPVYAEAERLGCALAVHGACHHGMGLDTLDAFVPIHGLGHPFSLLIAFTGMVYHGVFREFPRLRVGFLEGGAAWATFWTDRMDRSHGYFGEINPRGAYRGPAMEERPSDYLRNGSVFIGCEGGEQGLDYQVKRIGSQHFLFASDFPHEIGPEDIIHEIQEVREYPGLTEQDKEAILGGNARRFYQADGGR